ncbi:TVP38/TMEM64 family protein [Novacetimonas pomaceti]|nr:VTT domain-containing protein [Novacetimonas pomaceti]
MTRPCGPSPDATASVPAPASPSPPPAGLRVLLRPALMVAMAAGLVMAARVAPGLHAALSDVVVLRDGARGRAWFLLAGLAFCALGLPRQAVCLAAGMAYGTAEGMVMATCATVGGALVDFFAARALGGGRMPARLRGMGARLGQPLRERTFVTVLVLRLLPVGSAMMLSIAAGLARARMMAFVAATALGSLPQTAVFVLMGGGMQMNRQGRIALALMLFVASGLGGLWLLRASRIARADRATRAA